MQHVFPPHTKFWVPKWFIWDFFLGAYAFIPSVFVLIPGVVLVLVFNNVWTFACWCCECHALFSILSVFVVDLFFIYAVSCLILKVRVCDCLPNYLHPRPCTPCCQYQILVYTFCLDVFSFSSAIDSFAPLITWFLPGSLTLFSLSPLPFRFPSFFIVKKCLL